jgi:lysyl-tRNA synthetase class 2|tara:strand:+ start:3443 stop:4294 length:852 start_codon:yes stop_codon:yes gene_type:complete
LSSPRDWRPTCSVETIRARADIVHRIRAFFGAREVLEVSTPTLGHTTVTEPAVESLRLESGPFLQTSPEYYMKRLLAAGAPSIYQIGPVYRAEERGRWHNPEFTMLEWYRLGFNDTELMDEVAELVDVVLGAAPYQRLTYRQLTGGLVASRERLDLAFAQALTGLDERRTFVTDYPAEQAALARLREDDASVAARFELVVDGVELANGYFELGDASTLRCRFEADNSARELRGGEALALDERFLDAMAGGLPTCSGVALGLDRLVMLAVGANSLSEVMPFPDG